ncbi:hypothetical protein EDC04DRAFT_3034593 [Pisolithus marmoratus]|nr:hypothetical protein EDC04DRAFT_3034593 [Pisolithus marmoratus]
MDTFYEYLEYNNKRFADGSDVALPSTMANSFLYFKALELASHIFCLNCVLCRAVHATLVYLIQLLEDLLKQWNGSMCNLRFKDRTQFFVILKAKYLTYYKQIAGRALGVVFADTANKPSNLSLSEQATKSIPGQLGDDDSASADGQLVYPPYCQLGWDQMAAPLEWIAAMSVAQACHIIGVELYDDEGLMGFAISKLCGTTANKNLLLVTISQRFSLTLTLGHHAAVKFATSAMASHLRVCISITEDHNSSITTYTSELFLSCTAMASFHEEGNLDTFLQAFERKIVSSMVDIEDFWDLTGKEGKEAFEDVFINFSHWVSMDENIIPKDGDDHFE